jgi:hypothetical protein
MSVVRLNLETHEFYGSKKKNYLNDNRATSKWRKGQIV